jgi:hypothetical protein
MLRIVAHTQPPRRISRLSGDFSDSLQRQYFSDFAGDLVSVTVMTWSGSPM